MSRGTAEILWFEEIGIEQVPLVSGKNASLGERYRELTLGGVRYRQHFPQSGYRHAHDVAVLEMENKHEVFCL